MKKVIIACLVALTVLGVVVVAKDVPKSTNLYGFDHYVQECIWYRDLFGKNSYLSEHIGETLTFQVEFWKDMKNDTGEVVYVVHDESNEVYFVGEENVKTGRIDYQYSEEEDGQISLHQEIEEVDRILATYSSKDVMTLKQRIAYERVAYHAPYSVGMEDDGNAR